MATRSPTSVGVCAVIGPTCSPAHVSDLRPFFLCTRARDPASHRRFSPLNSCISVTIGPEMTKIGVYCRRCMRFVEHGPEDGPAGGGIEWIECDQCAQRERARVQLRQLERLWRRAAT